MAFGHTIPSVLVPNFGEGDKTSSISTERALRQIKDLLEYIPTGDEALEDRIRASEDDLDVMLRCIER